MKQLIYILLLLWTVPTISNADNPLDGLEKVSLDLEGVPLEKVLNMISRQYNLNLVQSGDVDGKISINLVDVDIATALDAILTANGFNYYVSGDVIIVKKADKYSKAELSSRMVTLHYIAPVTAKKAVMSRLSSLGTVVILDRKEAGRSDNDRSYRPNKILITDFARLVDTHVELVKEIDQPERTILIEARIIETTIDASTALGFRWPTELGFRMNDAEGIGTGSTTGTSTNTSGTINSSAGLLDFGSDKWLWGKLRVDQLRAALDILNQSGNSRLISDPRIMTTENYEAVIKIETIIPIQTINRFTEGAATSDIVTFEDEEIGISLTVTARINRGNTITLEVYPVIEDIIGFTGPTGNQKPITSSRSIKTRVTLQSGETVALGGLLKETETETRQLVPLLGHIPVLGKILFSNKSKTTSTTDLIIFITPTIID